MANAYEDIKSQVSNEALVQKRRAQIVTAAVELFSQQGFYCTTIQEIARKAGVSSGLIYQYVSDKEDVLLLALLSVLESYKREIPAAIEGLTDPLERWCVALAAYCRVVDQHRVATLLTYRSTKSLPEDRRRFIKDCEIETNELIASCLRACVNEEVFRAVNVDLVTYQAITFAHSWALKHWRLKEICTLDQYIREGQDFFAHALLTQKGWRQYKKLMTMDESAAAKAV